MSESRFDQGAWLKRIGYQGSRVPTLGTLRGLVDAHSAAISYESFDVLLHGRRRSRRHASTPKPKSAIGSPPAIPKHLPKELIAAHSGPGRTRVTLFNARLTVRYANGETERRMLQRSLEYRESCAKPSVWNSPTRTWRLRSIRWRREARRGRRIRSLLEVPA